MMEVDISHVWNALSLTDLLGIEAALSAAHSALTEGTCPGAEFTGWMALPVRNPTEETDRIRKAAERIRADSEICVVIGADGGCLGARAVMELVQGRDRNLRRGENDPRILFTGRNFSTRDWNHLLEQLEEKDYSLILVSGGEMPLETAIAFRSLRWKLERKYGTDEAAQRIYAVIRPGEEGLRRMAELAGWETFDYPADVTGPCSVLTAAGLLPMAVAGIDISAVLSGAADGKEHYDLRSFENPVWLYAALRSQLCRMGKTTELFSSFEPDFHAFGYWWQQLSGGAEGKNPFPVPLELTSDLHFLGQTIVQGAQPLFETVLRFAPTPQQHIIGLDWRDLDGLNYLDGTPVETVEEQAYAAILAAHTDAGIPVITMDCGRLGERSAGELLWFLMLGCSLSALVQGGNPFRSPAVDACRQALDVLLGRPEPEEPAQSQPDLPSS